ncbi:MAG: solute carrier family 23 protein, partial [Thermomicrobiales bacterium]
MQQIYQDGLDQLRMLFSWREKRSGVIGPDERLPWGNTIALGMQHVLAMFGSTVVAPLIMGFDPNLAILFSGIGTLLFFAITAGMVPSYLGSSFAFIAPVGAAMAGDGGMKAALGGIIAAGFVYLLIGILVHYTGSGWIDALMPPLVTGAVVAIIGLNLAGAARNLASASMPLAIITILAVMVIAILGRGMLGRLPILLGAIFGYLVALILGGTDAAGRAVGPMHISGVDFQPVRDAAWIGWPNFVAPSFNWHAISLIAPVAIILVAENTGHIKAVSEMTGRNLMPYLGRGFIGDGLATMIAGTGGGTGVTTYAENIGVMAVTRVFSTAIFVVAAITAIILGFCPKFGALIASIPNGVLGGIATVLFGLIAVTGVRIWVENRVDFSKSGNLFIAGVVLIAGAADYTINFGDFAMAGIGIGTFGAIILYQLFKALGIEDVPLVVDGPVGAADAAVPEPGHSGRGARPEPAMDIDRVALQRAFREDETAAPVMERSRRPARPRDEAVSRSAQRPAAESQQRASAPREGRDPRQATAPQGRPPARQQRPSAPPPQGTR